MNINNRLAENKTTEQCKNLSNIKPLCLCPNEKEVIKEEFSFKCIHCQRYFHIVCMKKKINSEFCCYCHIEKMIPVKKVVSTLYLGHFKRNIKKHHTSFFVPSIPPSQKIQVRCLRLREGAPTSCLFPDMAEIVMNGHHVK